MRKRAGIMFLTILLMLCGCGTDNQEKPKDNNIESGEEDWSPMPIEKMENVKEVVKVGQETHIEYLDVEQDYNITVDKVYTTQTFEEDMAEWAEIGLSDVNMEGDNWVTEDRCIVYVEYRVKNLNSEILKFGAMQVKVMAEQDGVLSQFAREIGYNSMAGTSFDGDMSNFVEIEPEEEVAFRIGYLITERTKEQNLYLELSGFSGDTSYVLLPIEENRQ